MPATILDDRAVLRLTGEQARGLLQGLVTNDVEAGRPGEAQFAALLSPQGKILFDFFVVGATHNLSDEVMIDCPRPLVSDLAKRLAVYRLRAAVGIEDVSSSLAVGAIWGAGEGADPPGALFTDPRHPRAGRRALVDRSRPWPVGSLQAYEAHRIALALPKGGVDFAYGDAFPHEAGMDRLHGLDFHKGCYVGQEVVSRMQHRGTVRNRIFRVGFVGQAPGPFTEIRAGDKLLGRMGSAAGEIGLAMLRTDRVEEALAAGAPIMAEDVALRLLGSDEA